jgi:hypothetical protein
MHKLRARDARPYQKLGKTGERVNLRMAIAPNILILRKYTEIL